MRDSTDRAMPVSALARVALLALLAVGIASCGGSPKSVLVEQRGPTMLEIMEGGGREGPSTRALDAEGAARRQALRRSGRGGDYGAVTRNALNETEMLFPLLPNPRLAMFVMPHRATSSGLPVPGYTTEFSLYDTPQYAMPSEIPPEVIPSQYDTLPDSAPHQADHSHQDGVR